MWYSRDLFWEELQKLRTCDNEGDYTDEEWMGALEALDERLRSNSALCTRMALCENMGPRNLEDRHDPAAKDRREYMGAVKQFKWYHYDVFCRFVREAGGVDTAISAVSERLFLECFQKTSEFLKHRRFAFLHSRTRNLLSEDLSAMCTD